MFDDRDRKLFKASISVMALVILFLSSLWLPIVVQAQMAAKVEPQNLHGVVEKLLVAERYQAAIAVLEKLLVLSQDSGDEHLQARVLTNLGIAENVLGLYERSLNHHKQAGKIFYRLGDRASLGQAFLNRGNTYQAIGDYDKAQTLYAESLKIAREFKNRPNQGTRLNNLGGLLVTIGDLKQARQVLSEGLTIQQELQDRSGQADILKNLGLVDYFSQQLPSAIAHYKQALKLAQQVQDRQLETDLLSGLGLIYGDQKDYKTAITFHVQSVAIAKTLNAPDTLANALNNQAETFFGTGQLKPAIALVNESIQVLEGLRPGLTDTYKVSIFDTQIKSYKLLEQALVADHQPELALEAAEKGRARAFAELLTSREGKLSIAPIDLTEIRRIAKTQKATIVEYSLVPDIDFRFLGKQQAPSERLLIWVVQPSGQISLRQVDLKTNRKTQGTINQMVAAARCLHPKPICPTVGEIASTRGIKIGTVQPTTVTPNDRSPQAPDISNALSYPGLPELHQILIAPIADLLPKDPNDRVVIIPTESLFLVPFPALVDAKGTYLVKQHTLLSAPSIQVLGLTARATQSWQNPAELVVLGNPSPMPESLDALPAAEREAIAVAKTLKTKPFIGVNATRENLLSRLGQAKLIHLATHGLLEYGQESGLDSMGAIALAQTATDKGLLTATTIASLKTRADLVVLSACDTGRGTITGDGVLGLARSWMAAGASSVVVSLWAVNDQSTSELMQAFYQGLAGQPDDRQSAKGDRAVALRQAMLETMAHYPSPYDWAAFSLMGQPGGEDVAI
jgi:CHAT domain-containing protein/tetratricopeptide (TPR) repeat protein